METKKGFYFSSRFYISIGIIAAMTVLCALNKIASDVFIATVTGLLAGFGIGKSGKKGDGVISPSSLLFPILFLVVGCTSCSTTLPQKINTTSASIKALSDVGLPIFHKVCLSAAIDCKSKNVTEDKCEAYKKCDTSREVFHKVLDSAQVACSTALAIQNFDKKNAETILLKSGELLTQAYSQLKETGVLPK